MGGASMWSSKFTAAGIRDVYFEFYPNGSTASTKEGSCSFYIKAPAGVSTNLVLFVGRVRKGPITVTFDSMTGKGLPDYCCLADEINQADDTLEIGIELDPVPKTTLL